MMLTAHLLIYFEPAPYFLYDMQALTRLQELDLHSNCISSLAPLSTLTSLVSLNAAANQLQDLPCLAGLTNLTELNLRHNLISALTAPPVAAAAGAVAGTPCSSGLLPASLQRLSLACNHLQDVSTLTGKRQCSCLYILDMLLFR